MMPDWAKKLPWDVMSIVAEKEGVDVYLMAAITQAESAGKRYAIRYEEAYAWTYKVDEHAKLLGITRSTEKESQCYSYSYMQIMGATARSHGHSGHMGELFDPHTAFTYGAKHLASLLAKYKGADEAIAAYNAGHPRRLDGGGFVNAGYVTKVLTFLAQLK